VSTRDPAERAALHHLDELANTARECNADAISTSHGLEYWAVSHFGRMTWLLRVRGCLITISRADLQAVLLAAMGGAK
jgi:hypothetical protein